MPRNPTTGVYVLPAAAEAVDGTTIDPDDFNTTMGDFESALNDVNPEAVDINGGAIDGVTLGTNDPVAEAQIDNVNINGNTISSTDTDGDLTLDPNGTGDVVLASGNLVLPAAGGIDFSANTADASGVSAEVFDDYEEGSFTPEFVPTSGAFTTITYSAQAGQYVKFGPWVEWSASITVSSLNKSGGTGLRLSGLPFNAANSTNVAGIGFVTGMAENIVGGRAVSGADEAIMYFQATHGANWSIADHDSLLNGTQLIIGGAYLTS